MPAFETAPLIQKTQSSASRVKQGSLTNEDVLRSEIPWPAFQNAGIISKEQLEMMYLLDKQTVDNQVAQFEANGVALADLMSVILAGVNKDEVIQYILAMLDELLLAAPSIAGFFHELLVTSKGYNDPFGPLMKLLTRSSLYVLEKATALLGKLLAYKSNVMYTDPHAEQVMARHLATFTEWVMYILKAVDPANVGDSPKIQYALLALQNLVGTNTGRAACIAADGLPTLCGLMSGGERTTSSALQLLYQVVYCLWSLSYYPEAALEMVTSKVGLVAKLVDIVKSIPKEKVVRVGLATLRNLLGTGSASSDMVGVGIMKVLASLQTRKWADEDIVEDIEFLNQALQVNVVSMSSWDMYSKELATGKLEWSPSHKSENFWRDNYKGFETNKFEAIKQLVALLESDDAQTLAIACHDISEFVKHHPEGRRLMTQHGAKQPAMAILKHADPEVQKHALTCVQRLMVINWEYLGSREH
jgi:V-type H+-transporting ATPase subunit H